MDATVGNTKTLEIDNVTAASGGEYVCFVINDAGIGFSTSSLFVVPYITEDPMDAEVYLFDELTLSCNAESFPEPTFQWQKLNDENEPEDLPEENSTFLIFNSTLVSHGGVYRCAATNIINETEYTAFTSKATIIG